MIQQPPEILIKLLIIGPREIGKTSLLNRLTQNNFSEQYLATNGVDFGIKRTYINNQPVKLQIWDSSIQERFRKVILKLYYKGVHGIFFTFDISNEKSFLDVKIYYERTMMELKKFDLIVQCILIGCKSDLEQIRNVSHDLAMAYAKSLGMQYFEISSKTNRNCVEAADHLAQLCFEQIVNQKAEEDPIEINTKFQGEKNSTCF